MDEGDFWSGFFDALIPKTSGQTEIVSDMTNMSYLKFERSGLVRKCLGLPGSSPTNEVMQW